MNPSSLIGIVASILLMVVILAFSADNPQLYLDWPSLAIVLGGTVAATFLSYPLRDVVRIFGLFRTVLRDEHIDIQSDINELVQIAKIWVTGDSHAVEQALTEVTNPFLRTGVQLIIDRIPEQDILDLLQWRISRLRTREAAEAQLFRLMANYAPAFGMLGTLVGLINVMGNMGNGDMPAFGQNLAMALMTTLYGILLSNLLFRPVAVKLERRTEQRLILMNMVLQGISMMCAKSSPGLMRETLKSFVAHYEDEIFDGAVGQAEHAEHTESSTRK
ncbi:chemotaxis protein PomA [Rhodoferax lithotrophicus]|uniref:Chemotaxis protein PomA n=1 Tax=Rhodoferax lithotrophicus TaxID=2798804 RepID=A0ABN6D300_9BURK|nr:MotA/TolQ/ExbB proton channel family protein [Rhodoferax sp. MIZ03]BCO26384.1 chemotaxis protein PomA [Rhodoferax sp. MIZ03]